MNIEISRWGEPASKSAPFVIQPYYVSANTFRFVAAKGTPTFNLRWERQTFESAAWQFREWDFVVSWISNPMAAALIGACTLGIAFSWLPRSTPKLFDAPVPSVLVVTSAWRSPLSGRGAFSVDSRLFANIVVR